LGKPKKTKNCENMKKNCKRRSEKKNQTQLKTTGHNVEGEEKKCRQSSEKYGKRSAQSQRSKLAADATF